MFFEELQSGANLNIEASKLSFQKVDYAILSAMPEELEYFQELWADNLSKYSIDGFEFNVYEYKNKTILMAHTGLGTTFAACVLTLIHQHFRPDFVFFSGTAGGINPQLKLCDVIIIEKAFEAEIQGAFKLLRGTPFEGCLTHPLKKQSFPSTYFANEKLLTIASTIHGSGVYKGTAVTSNTFPAPPELFEAIKAENPYSIDMETSAIYQVAWLLNIPVLAVRGISNLLNYDGTDDKIAQSDVKGSSEAAAKCVLKIVEQLLIEENVHDLKVSNLGFVPRLENSTLMLDIVGKLLAVRKAKKNRHIEK